MPGFCRNFETEYSKFKNGKRGDDVNEKTKTFLIVSAVVYGVILFASGIVYILMSVIGYEPMAHAVATESPKEEVVAPPAPTKKELPKEEKKTTEEDEEKKKAAKEREEARKKKIQEENHANWDKNKTYRSLTSSMTEKVRGNVTFYTHDYNPEPEKGVYIRPFVIQGKNDAILKNDVYYFVSLSDDAFDWIHGDRVDITADGVLITWQFDPTKRRDHLGKGAETISENYVETASKSKVDDLKRIGNAANVTVRYYKTNGGGITSVMSRENIRHIRDMVSLYETLTKPENSEEKKK